MAQGEHRSGSGSGRSDPSQAKRRAPDNAALKAAPPARGWFSLSKIVLQPGQSPAEEFAPLAHECAQALLHGQDRRSARIKRARETEAEAVAFVVCEAIGIKAQNSADYIHLYSGDQETLAESFEPVQRASSEILTSIISSTTSSK